MLSLSKSLLGSVAVFALAAAASSASAAVFCVNLPANPGCTAKTTISAAVAAAAAGDTVLIGAGTYHEQVTITKPLSIGATPGTKATIDAAGKSNGIFINGLAATPNVGVANVVVTGLEVENANYEGIVAVNAANVSILNNHVHNNNKMLSNSTCPGIAAWETSEAMDCGEGIHLVAVNHSTISRNLVENNAGGILISDETGSTFENTVSDNVVHDNGYACGITMASHGAANASGPIQALNYGIWHNIISSNQSYHNGTVIPGSGAGVGIFAPGPGATNMANIVIGNDLHDNGHPGVAMHNHASIPGAPPVVFNDNKIIGNHIYNNGSDTADGATSGPTGINIYSAGSISGTVVAQNTVDNESIGIAFKAPANSTLITHLNNFNANITGVENLGSGTIDATENWWNCTYGPGSSSSCANPSGSNVTTLPYLLQPYNPNW
ncbi:MAG TPA: right-handed parallel beta-helix repeat-containing protein [Acidobacteriaceae bacterium]|nr:right-handed parallel beta-helix repeat-containing protein [Acidobacteriaceae bacterium]